ncbi:MULTISPECIES: THUMP domain-containing class I SAM-dependent RNA methyltransferase [Candidatus Accumulibacter]|uniref:Ribosomal RNA large subunit methyltransferase L n=2 Tax=Candidatus Accumulibacter TaxID=327159 RepID=A0A080M7J3_9PROT|nr:MULTISPECIES: THUMP domain-containing protein [Candidatus Accumulibacter]KFB76951.1 MAG: Ribosomal RNA large subunit methyltransferase L [Candidatus Accumulibacter cognatus]MCC2868048.1 THUMP domain-containing protein [Candidatus Accumulibacter phosphatis]TMQ77978.1 23S rRNA (guanine-N-2-) -methyltransferase rlmL [Candidatus Accumulibacter phosphatis]
METFFASCPRGLEQLLLEDLRVAGARDLKSIFGGVHFLADWPVCYRANLYSRIATRILWRVALASYRNEEDIYRLALDTPWPKWFVSEQTFRVDVNAVKSTLKSLEFVTLRIKDAICDRFRRETGKRPSVDTRQPDLRVHGFISKEECILYLDTSGAPLYQRGLRQKTVDAPIKENLAAGILRLSGWQPGVALLDPMCGSGTFLLEAAQIALGVAPGARRPFAFEQLRHFDLAVWQRLLEAARAGEAAATDAGIFGSDLSPAAVRASLANLDRAGLLPLVTLSTGDLLEIKAPAEHGVMVSNPPYAERVFDRDQLAQFYPLLGSALKRRFAGWNCYLISADTRLPKMVRLTPSKKTPLFNGALECRLYEFRMVAGSNRGNTANSSILDSSCS